MSGRSGLGQFRTVCRDGGARALTTGASFGAFHAANAFFRRPDQFGGTIAMSGSYENLAGALDSLSKIQARQGQHEAAIATYRRTLQIRELKFGKEHPAVASILDSLGAALQDAGESHEAFEHHQRALAIYEAQPRPPRETGHVLAHLGRCLLALDRGTEALSAYERSHALLRSHGASSAELARVRFGMAQALFELGKDRDRMLDLARLARDAFAAGGTTTRELYAEVRRWLQDRGEG